GLSDAFLALPAPADREADGVLMILNIGLTVARVGRKRSAGIGWIYFLLPSAANDVAVMVMAIVANDFQPWPVGRCSRAAFSSSRGGSRRSDLRKGQATSPTA